MWAQDGSTQVTPPLLQTFWQPAPFEIRTSGGGGGVLVEAEALSVARPGSDTVMVIE
jgi:hypothetical protein